MTNTFNKEGPFDRPLAIAVANMVNAKRWQNKTITFSELSERLETTVRTNETVDEYRKGSKELRQKAKDQGGFVAGYLKDGKRVAGSVGYRSMLTLDADNAEQDLIDRLVEESDVKLIIYTTHGHAPTEPRIRIIVPLNRDVTPDEFNALSRYFADKWGIEQFDPVSFRPMQLMFWPSTPKDGEYISCLSKAKTWMDPDKELENHPDWKDITTLPTLKRENPKRGAGRLAEDPLKKKGIVGAFCRTYTVEEAIEKFLSDVYEPSNIEGRYNYIESSSIAGVLIYEHKWAYSHHASDPAYGKLLNAFDLVRVTEFGNLDTETGNFDNQSSIPISRCPSFRAMEEFALGDEKVRLLLLEEKQKDASSDFSECTEDDDSWKKQLKFMTRSTVLQNNVWNEMVILNNDKNLRGFAFNEMARMVEVIGEVPWSRPDDNSFWREADTAQLKAYLDIKYVPFSDRNHTVAFTKVADDRRFHPIKDYFASLPVWDGTHRVDDLFIKYLKADDTAYVKAVTRKTLVAAVSRILHPGCKFDSVTVLDGIQGIGKSTIWKALAGDKYFSDALSLTDMDDKSGAEKLQGFWIIEIGELAGMKKADIEKVKSFISTSDDKYRPSYGRTVESHPRQSIVVATVNGENGYLRDTTGNRRFWIIKCHQQEKTVKWKITEDERDQIWAEALHYFKCGEKLYLEDELLRDAENAQRDAMEADERLGMVEDYLEKLLPDNWHEMDIYARRSFLSGDELSARNGTIRRNTVSNPEIWCECFGKNISDLKTNDSYAIGALMSRIKGWKRSDRRKRIGPYGQQRIYVRKEVE